MMELRRDLLARLRSETFDVVIIGGGINGAVSAAALAGQGAKVALIDRGDFAGLTSQASSNLAWGGIKYLETFELGLVRKLCMSRNRLLRAFPSIVREIRFYAHIERGFRFRPSFLYLGGLFYWFIGNCFTRRPRLLTRQTIAAEEPEIDLSNSAGGFEYSDAYLHDNDARFVFHFIRSAHRHGAAAVNYVESRGARRDEAGNWAVDAVELVSGEPFTVRARALVNACGPYVDAHNALTGQTTAHRHLFSKGIHLIVPRITSSPRVLTFFADDGRLFFAIPMGNRTVIGTTDTRVPSPETEVTPEDRRFVLSNINKRVKLPRPLTEADIISERCGVRPLVVETSQGDAGGGDWTRLSRKHYVDADLRSRHLSIFGGKLTDCLNVGEEVTDRVSRMGISLPGRGARWYGEPPPDTRAAFFARARDIGLDAMASPHASEPLSNRLWRRYGKRAFAMLDAIAADPRMAEVLIETSEYLRCEIVNTAEHELVTHLEDFLRRRSKIAMVVEHERLRRSPGLREACHLLFGDRAEAEWEAYFGEPWDGLADAVADDMGLRVGEA